MPSPGWQQPSAAPAEMTASTGGCEHRGLGPDAGAQGAAEREQAHSRAGDEAHCRLLYSAQNKTLKIQLQHTKCHLE